MQIGHVKNLSFSTATTVVFTDIDSAAESKLRQQSQRSELTEVLSIFLKGRPHQIKWVFPAELTVPSVKKQDSSTHLNKDLHSCGKYCVNIYALLLHVLC